MHKFKATVFSIKKDRDGEVKLVLVVPMTEVDGAWAMKPETVYDIIATQEDPIGEILREEAD